MQGIYLVKGHIKIVCYVQYIISPALTETGLRGTAILMSDKVEYLRFSCNVLLLATTELKTTRLFRNDQTEEKFDEVTYSHARFSEVSVNS